MLVQKLRIGNLQSERGRYDGAMVYAQHKVRGEGGFAAAHRAHHPPTGVCVLQRQQVVMTEQLARTHTSIHFSVMHPGWVDTPGSLSAMFPPTLPSLIPPCPSVPQRWLTACRTSTAP